MLLRRRAVALFLWAVLALPSHKAEAQAISFEGEKALSQYRVDRWQTDQGLPLDTVQAIAQTRDGYLWVGTSGGLARFDGVQFKTWSVAIASLSIFALMEDSEGALWIGHSRGAAIYRNGQFAPAFPETLAEGRRVWGFAQGIDGTVWVASEAGLVRVASGSAKVFRVEDGLPTNRLRSLAFDRDGTLWIATTGGGLVSFAAGKFKVFDPSSGFPKLEVRAVLADPEGGVWVATAGGGLVRVNEGRTTVYSVKDGLPTDQLTSLTRDDQGSLWIGTWGSGVTRMSGGRFTSLSTEGGLAADQIWSMHADHEGSVWVGTWVGGLNRLSNRPFLAFGAPEGLSGNNARSVLHARDGSTWVATAGGGLNVIKDGRVRSLRKKDGLPSDETSTLYEDGDGAIWVGTYTAGVARIRGGRSETFDLRHGLPNVDVHAFLRDRDGVFWAGTMSGLARFEGGRFAAVREPGAPKVGVLGIAQDRSGTLWFATSEGLGRFRNGVFDVLTKADGLASSWVLSILEDRAGDLWIGSNGDGLTRLRNGRASIIRPDDGLWDGIVQVILEDRQANLWMTGNRGFFRVSLDELNGFADGRLKNVKSLAYGPGDALRSTSFAGGHQAAGAMDSRGLLWLPSFNGAVIVDPARLPGAGKPPPALIEEVTVNGSVLSQPREVILPPGPSSLSIRYTAMTLGNAARARFRYRMEGLAPGWIEAGRTREASFPALPHGTYDFHVATSTDGVRWVEPALPLRLVVQPHFYERRGFSALAAFGVGGLILGLVRLRLRALRRQHEEMERIVALKTEELRLANEHLSQLSFSDAQTGLANRRRFDETLEKEWRRGHRFRTSLAVVMADIDAFKGYNDTLGHPEGDRCLAAVAEVFRRSAVRAGDLAARYGGEEFVVLIPSADREAALGFAEKLRQACEERAIPHPASPVSAVVTISVGVAAGVPSTEVSAATLVAQADAALYRAKREGRNLVR